MVVLAVAAVGAVVDLAAGKIHQSSSSFSLSHSPGALPVLSFWCFLFSLAFHVALHVQGASVTAAFGAPFF